MKNGWLLTAMGNTLRLLHNQRVYENVCRDPGLHESDTSRKFICMNRARSRVLVTRDRDRERGYVHFLKVKKTKTFLTETRTWIKSPKLVKAKPMMQVGYDDNDVFY